MLKVTGTIGGKQLKDTNVSTKELIEEFDLKEEVDKLKQTVIFDVFGEYTKKSSTGQLRAPEQVSILTTYSVLNRKSGEQVEITYYKKSVRKNAPNNGGTYEETTPHKIFITGGTMAVRKEDDLEMIVFLLLHPKNGNSKNYQNGTPTDFQTRKEQDDAKKAVKFAHVEFSFKEKVLKGELDELRLRSEGIGLGSFSSLNDEEVRASILNAYENTKLDAARNNGNHEIAATNFVNKFFGSIATIKGNIVSAKQRGMIWGHVSNTTGKYAWKWVNGVSDEMRDKIIVECPQGTDPDDVIYRYFMNEPEQLKMLENMLNEMRKVETEKEKEGKKAATSKK